jgi:hypothetical protein
VVVGIFLDEVDISVCAPWITPANLLHEIYLENFITSDIFVESALWISKLIHSGFEMPLPVRVAATIFFLLHIFETVRAVI